MRRFGLIHFKVDGEVFLARGNFSYNLGGEDREEVMGADTMHGVRVQRRPAHIEGEISDTEGLDLRLIQHVSGATVTLELENGKVIRLRDATQVGEATGNTEEGNINVRFVGPSAREIS